MTSVKKILKNIDLYAEDSIVKYLKQYQIKIKHSYTIDHYGRVGDLFLLLDRQKIGHLHYSVDSSIKNLHIDKIKIDSKLRGDIPLKFSKLILIYVLSFYAKRILTVSLTAISSLDLSKRGEEYCLPCFYQTLGFDPVMDDVVKNELNECIIQLKNKGKYEDIENMCLLCKCQRNRISFSKRDLRYLQVDMKALLPNLVRSLESLVIHVIRN